MGRAMIHLNGNLLCAIDTETTGLRPFYHDICEICILPLDANIEILKDITPFYCQIIPRNVDRIDLSAMSVNKLQMSNIMRYGIDSFKAADLFEQWFNNLGLGIRKKISPLAQNWKFDWAFIMDWLGVQNMDYFFDGRYRDTFP
jgi:oligoribonuclease (3'-5' exoribonuclease)